MRWFNKIRKNLQPKFFIHQPDIYSLAAFLGDKFGCDCIIDVGCGTANKLVKLHPDFKIIGIDFKENIKRCVEKYDFGEWMDYDLENSKPLKIDVHVVKKSVIVCADVIEHLKDPTMLLSNLKKLLEHSPVCLISTPDRDLDPTKLQSGPPRNPHHVREWTVKEFSNLLDFYNFNVPFVGHMVNNDKDLLKQSILAVMEQNNAKIDFRKAFEKPPKDFKVTVIIPTYNETDIISHTIKKFVDEGIDVYVLDNWSTDDTVHKVKKFVDKGVIGIEKFPKDGPDDLFRWNKILSRIEQITLELKSNWFIFNDADVVKKSPWKGVNLKTAIYAVDQAGYNAIDHTSATFRPVDNSYSSELDPEKHFKFFEFRKAPGQFRQIKTWKNTNKSITLVPGGHQVQFEGRAVYPYKFLHKHYPILSQKQGERKILQERKARYDPAEVKAGMHTHYKQFTKGEDFSWSEDELNRFDETFYGDFMVELISGVGIRR